MKENIDKRDKQADIKQVDIKNADSKIEKQNKGYKTRKYIQEKAHELFVMKGFKSVTMKDICEVTGLSRGGLYRHFSSTEEIFQTLFHSMAYQSQSDIESAVDAGEPAKEILEHALQAIHGEMLADEKSLSLAMHEYASVCGKEFFAPVHQAGYSKWKKLIEYGIHTGEFRQVEVDEMVDVILFSYQGVRMWSRIMEMDSKTVDHITNFIRKCLLI